MKKKLYSLILGATVIAAPFVAKAQTTATPYNFVDCAGNPQSLFAELDAGKALILEFFMTSCSPCIGAGQTLEIMKADLMAEFPGMIKAYAFGFSDSYTCTAINNWVTTNGITSIPSDSGAYQVAYYGGMGMPTIVILGGGTSHSVLGTPYLTYTTSDTTTMAADIRNFLNGTGVAENCFVSKLNVFPNPAGSEVKVSFEMVQTADVKIELFDIAGRLIAKLADKKSQTGLVNETVNTAIYPDGSYIMKITSNGVVTPRKLNIVH